MLNNIKKCASIFSIFTITTIKDKYVFATEYKKCEYNADELLQNKEEISKIIKNNTLDFQHIQNCSKLQCIQKLIDTKFNNIQDFYTFIDKIQKTPADDQSIVTNSMTVTNKLILSGNNDGFVLPNTTTQVTQVIRVTLVTQDIQVIRDIQALQVIRDIQALRVIPEKQDGQVILETQDQQDRPE